MILLCTSAMNQSIVIVATSSYEEESLDSLVRESLSFRDQWL